MISTRPDLVARLRTARLEELPRPASLDEYDAALDEMLDQLLELPGIVAVYQTGSVSDAGISDIDLIAVIEPEAHLFPIHDRLSERTQYLSMHSPLVADVTSFRLHRWFSSPTPLDLLWGEAIEIVEPPDRGYLDLVQAAEGLIASWLRVIKQGALGQIKVRPALCELNALKYDLAMVGMTQDRAEEQWRLVQRIQQLRKNWFLVDPADPTAIRESMVVSLDVLGKTLEVLAERVEEGSFVRAGNNIHEMRLGVPWHNTALRPRQGRDLRVVGPRWWDSVALVGVHPLLPKLAWRVSQWTLEIPLSLVKLVNGFIDHRFEESRLRRSEIVRAYRAFVDEHAAMYSKLSSAPLFVR